MFPSHPAILCLSGFDPSGGAGIQADIESISSMGGHAVPVITASTVQNTVNIQQVQATDAAFFRQQLDVLLDDIAIRAIKIGLTGSVEIVECIAEVLQRYPELPVVLDPVLAAGGGRNLADASLIDAIRQQLLPHVTVLTPNSVEARQLAQQDDLLSCGTALLQLGCEAVLITGTHEDSEHVDNLWFEQGRHRETFSWDRLPHDYHGSGCTLASAIAALLAQGLDGFTAVNEAQDYSWHTLQHAFRISQQGQYIPNRFYWQHQFDED